MFLSVAIFFVAVLAVALLLALLWAVGLYNGLMAARGRVRSAFTQMEAQIKQRYSLIPSLVETARTHMRHERETLDAVISAGTVAVGAFQAMVASPSGQDAIQNWLRAEQALGSAMGRLASVSEVYPELKADGTIVQLSEKLTLNDSALSLARESYNSAVTAYHSARQTFPVVLCVGFLGFQEAPLCELKGPAQKETSNADL